MAQDVEGVSLSLKKAGTPSKPLKSFGRGGWLEVVLRTSTPGDNLPVFEPPPFVVEPLGFSAMIWGPDVVSRFPPLPIHSVFSPEPPTPRSIHFKLPPSFAPSEDVYRQASLLLP